MAKGLAVLEAALAGKRIRCPELKFTKGHWLWWHPGQEQFVDDEGQGYGLSVWHLMREGWQIEEPTLTFMEAVVAMDAGQTVERITSPELAHLQMRRRGDVYETRTILADGRTTKWGPILISSPAMLATDWRVVPTAKATPEDERPTLRDARAYLTGMAQAELEAADTANFVAQWTLTVLAEWKPGLFRPETA